MGREGERNRDMRGRGRNMEGRCRWRNGREWGD